MIRTFKGLFFVAFVVTIALVLSVLTPPLAAHADGDSRITLTNVEIERADYGYITYDIEGTGESSIAAGTGACGAYNSYGSTGCGASLQVRWAIDGSVHYLEEKGLVFGSQPYVFDFENTKPSRTIDAVRVVLVSGNAYLGDIVGPWYGVSDPYPISPTVEFNSYAFARTPTGDIAYDITLTGAGMLSSDLACTIEGMGIWHTTGCNSKVTGLFSNGSTHYIAAQLETRSDPLTAHLTGTVSASYLSSWGRLIAIRPEFTTWSTLIDDVVGDWQFVRDPRFIENIGGGNPAIDGCSCEHGDPVNTANGEFYLPATDLSLPGMGPGLAVARTYSSLNLLNGPFGYGWASAFGAKLNVVRAGDGGHPLPYEVEVVQENGSVVPFLEDGGEYPAAPYVRASLEHDPVSGEWTFTRRSHDVLVFDSNGRLVTWSDPRGNALSYSYDGSGKLASITAPGGREIDLTWTGSRVTSAEDSGGREVSYGYDGEGDLTEFTDASGATWTYTYSSHRLTSLTSPEGGTTTNTYDGSGRISTQTDPEDRETGFSYEGFTTTVILPDGSETRETYNQGNIVQRIEAAGTEIEATTSYEYDLSGNLAAIVDPLNHRTISTYDENGNELSTTDPLDRTTTRTFDEEGHVTSVEDALNRTTEMEYTEYGEIETLTNPGARVQEWTYDANGNLDSRADARGKVTSYTHDSAGRLVCTTDPEFRETCVDYDSRGFIVSSLDGAAKETVSTYDDLGRLLTVTDPLNEVTTYTYDQNGNVLTVENAEGETTSYEYDDADQLISLTSPSSARTTYTYTDRGQLATVTDPNENVTTRVYDELNRLVSVTDPLGRTTAYTYDLAGQLIETELPSGALIQSAYDDAGQLISVTDPLESVTEYAYDDAGQLIAVTDPLERVTETTYTVEGWAETVTYPDTSVETYEHNANGQETSFTDADGLETTYSYDDSGKVVGKTEPGGLETSYGYTDTGLLERLTKPDGHAAVRDYDDAGHLLSIDYSGAADDVSYTYDAVGRRLTMSDASGTTTYAYDDDGSLTSVENGAGQDVSYEYDDAGRLVGLTYPGDLEVTYDYDDAGQMVGISGWWSGATTLTYTLDGRLETRSDPNGVTETRTYDDADRVTHIEAETSLNSISSYQYSYDDAGQLVGTTLNDALHTAVSQSWGHDLRSQLTTTSPTTAYAATSAGRLTATEGEDALTYNLAGQLEELENSTATTSFSYDDNGARVESSTSSALPPVAVTSYGWNESGHLTSTDDGTTNVSYVVDGDGIRQERSEGMTDRQFLWDSNAAIPLLLDDDEHTYVYGPGLTPFIQFDSSGDPEFLYTDNLGSVRNMADDSGALDATVNYDPYGNVLDRLGSGHSDIGYTGAWTDSETGLVYLRARDYDPNTAQFLSVDPLVDSTRQPYAYAANTPLSTTDPTGLCIGLDYTAQDRPCTYNDFYWDGVWQKDVLPSLRGFENGFSGGITEMIRGKECYDKNGWHWVEYGLGTALGFVIPVGVIGRAATTVLKAGKMVETQQAVHSLATASDSVHFRADTTHIFRVDDGHLATDTIANRAIIESAIEAGNLVKTTDTSAGPLRAYRAILEDGTQAWAEVLNGREITNGGVNRIPIP